MFSLLGQIMSRRLGYLAQTKLFLLLNHYICTFDFLTFVSCLFNRDFAQC